METFKESMTAAEGVVVTMTDYAKYSAQSKFPNVIDSLKPVQRRIILTMHENSHVQKEATLAGKVMEKHPHGDASISAAISGLAQPFTQLIPLVASKSSVGTYVGEPPAAARYVDVYEADAANDLFFKGTDKSALRWVPCESEEGLEPANFVPVIPTAMIMPMIGIAVGYKTETSGVSIANACKLAKKFVELKFKYPDTYRKKALSLAPYMIPDFPSFCHLRNADQIVAEYKKGNFDCPFIIDGLIEVYKDNITVTTLPPDRTFGKTTQDAGETAAQDKTSWLYEHFTEMADYADKKQSNVKGNFRCVLRRGENPFDLLAMFRRQFQLSTKWSPTRIYFDEDIGSMTFETPITLLDKWASARYKVVLGGLKQRLNYLSEQYRKLLALIIVVDHAKEVCDIFRTAKDEEATVGILSKKFGLSIFQAKYLWTLPLKSLTAKGKQELLNELEGIKQKNKELQQKFVKIADEIISGIEAFEKKYAHAYPPKCTVPKYIGTACYKNTGWIQIENIDECDEVLRRFNTDISFNLYDGPVCVIGSDEPIMPNIEPPKYLKASYMGSNSGCKYIAVKAGDGIMLTSIPTAVGTIDGDPVPVGDKFSIITKEGYRQVIQTNAKLVRVTKSAMSPTIKSVIYTSPNVDDEVFVVHCNSKVPGVVNIDRIKGNAKISKIIVGKTTVLGIYKIGVPVLFSIPDEISVRTPVKHVYVEDLQKFVAPNSTMKLLLTKKRTSTDKNIVLRTKRSAIHTISD